jgi:hypothetical protein
VDKTVDDPSQARKRPPIALLALAGIALVFLGESFGYVRAAIGLALLVAFVAFGFKYWRDVGLIPPEPEPTDVSDFDLKYVCRVCGLELRVEVAAKDKPPKHCGEAMQLVPGGTPPLRPI